jgi:hypothetical protein
MDASTVLLVKARKAILHGQDDSEAARLAAMSMERPSNPGPGRSASQTGRSRIIMRPQTISEAQRRVHVGGQKSCGEMRV